MSKTRFFSRLRWTLALAGLSLTSFTQAATLYVSTTGTDAANNCTSMSTPCGTIAYAVAQASPGDEILLANGVYNMTSTILVNKQVTIRGESEGGVVLQGGLIPGSYFFVITGAGASLRDLTIVSTTNTGTQNLTGIQAADVTIDHVTYQGQYLLGDPEVVRAIETSGTATNFTFTNNVVTGLRQPAYINAGSNGLIANNSINGTRGFVVDGGNFNFTNNTFSGNFLDIVILAGTNPAYYSDLGALSAANNYAVVQDQRTQDRITCSQPRFSSCPGAQTAYSAPYACTAMVSYVASASANAGTPTVSYTFTGATSGSGSGTGSGSIFNGGVTHVTISAVNDCGTATCSFDVTVNSTTPQCSIIVTPENNTNTGGVPTNIYLGYGPQKATLSVNAGPGITSYVWTGPVGTLSNPGAANPVFTPTAPGTYTFNVTTTNGNGCSNTCSVTFCVKDVNVPDGKGKVYLCHQGNTLSVSPSAVAAHLTNHSGDMLGYCGQTCGNTMARSIAAARPATEVTVYPNPSHGSFTVALPYIGADTRILVTDVQGRVVTRQTVTADDSNKVEVRLGGAAPGIYFVEVNNDGEQYRTKMIVE